MIGGLHNGLVHGNYSQSVEGNAIGLFGDGSINLNSYRKSTEFDGVNEYVSYGGNVVTAGEGSISLWIKLLSRSATNGAAIFYDSGGYIGLVQQAGGLDGYYFGIYDTGGKIGGTFSITLNTWTHIICTWKIGDKPLVYKNAVAQPLGALAQTGNIGNITLPFRIGGRGSATYQQKCRVNLWEVWNKKITASEALEFYNSGYSLPPQATSFSFNLTHSYLSGNRDSYPIILDRKGNKNGTMTNMQSVDFVYDSP